MNDKTTTELAEELMALAERLVKGEDVDRLNIAETCGRAALVLSRFAKLEPLRSVIDTLHDIQRQRS